MAFSRCFCRISGDWSGGLALSKGGGASSLLVSLVGLLLVLSSSDGVLSLLLSDLWLLELLVEDFSVAESSDSLGGLDVTSNTSLHGSFLADTLLVLASVEDGPSKLSWVLLGVVQGGDLVVDHSDDLSVDSAVADAVTGVDLEAAEVTKLSAHISESRKSIC